MDNLCYPSTKTERVRVCACLCVLDRSITQLSVGRFGWYFGGWSLVRVGHSYLATRWCH